jgi:ATP-binding cassette subfamily B protein
MHGRTTFVIAHRISTVRAADAIMVLDGGRLVATGTHEELLVSSPVYRDIHASQLVDPEAQAAGVLDQAEPLAEGIEEVDLLDEEAEAAVDGVRP